jgi:hypothetical protein
MVMALAVLTTSAFGKGKPSPSPSPTSTAFDSPVLSCESATTTTITVHVCGGPNTGAPAGFSVQWMTEAAFIANGSVWPTDETQFCKASFSGVPNCSNFNLAPSACVGVELGDVLFDQCGASSGCANIPLDCDTRYVFRAFAHADSTHNRSAFTNILTCSTAPCVVNCDLGCTLTQGFWKTHGPAGCVQGNNCNTWPVTSLTLGTVTYTDLELCAIFNEPAGGNGLLALAHQLIAAKLNIASGASATAIQWVIDDADALIGSLVIPPVGSGYLAPGATSTDTDYLDTFNNGEFPAGPPHCLDEENPPCQEPSLTP